MIVVLIRFASREPYVSNDPIKLQENKKWKAINVDSTYRFTGVTNTILHV